MAYAALSCAQSGMGRTLTKVEAAGDAVQLLPGEGAQFPSLVDGDFFYAYLRDPCGSACEQVKVTGTRGDTFTIEKTGADCFPPSSALIWDGDSAEALAARLSCISGAAAPLKTQDGTIYIDIVALRAALQMFVLSGTSPIIYDNSSGDVSFDPQAATDVMAADIRKLFSGAAPITYDPATGVIGFNGSDTGTTADITALQSKTADLSADGASYSGYVTGAKVALPTGDVTVADLAASLSSYATASDLSALSTTLNTTINLQGKSITALQARTTALSADGTSYTGDVGSATVGNVTLTELAAEVANGPAALAIQDTGTAAVFLVTTAMAGKVVVDVSGGTLNTVRMPATAPIGFTILIAPNGGAIALQTSAGTALAGRAQIAASDSGCRLVNAGTQNAPVWVSV